MCSGISLIFGNNYPTLVSNNRFTSPIFWEEMMRKLLTFPCGVFCSRGTIILQGAVNMQNCKKYGTEGQDYVYEVSESCELLSVQCKISQGQVVNLYFFENGIHFTNRYRKKTRSPAFTKHAKWRNDILLSFVGLPYIVRSPSRINWTIITRPDELKGVDRYCGQSSCRTWLLYLSPWTEANGQVYWELAESTIELRRNIRLTITEERLQKTYKTFERAFIRNSQKSRIF